MVVAARVERQLADEVAGLVEDSDVQIVHQNQDAGSGVAPTEPDVVQLAVVAQRDDAAGVYCTVPASDLGAVLMVLALAVLILVTLLGVALIDLSREQPLAVGDTS